MTILFDTCLCEFLVPERDTQVETFQMFDVGCSLCFGIFIFLENPNTKCGVVCLYMVAHTTNAAIVLFIFWRKCDRREDTHSHLVDFTR